MVLLSVMYLLCSDHRSHLFLETLFLFVCFWQIHHPLFFFFFNFESHKDPTFSPNGSPNLGAEIPLVYNNPIVGAIFLWGFIRMKEDEREGK